MTGDIPGAEAIFAEYEAARRAANDPTIGLMRAEWDHSAANVLTRSAIWRTLPAHEDSETSLLWRIPLSPCGFWTQATVSARASTRPSGLDGWKSTTALAGACRFVAEPTGDRLRIHSSELTLSCYRIIHPCRPVAARDHCTLSAEPQTKHAGVLAWALVETGAFDEAAKYRGVRQSRQRPARLPSTPWSFPNLLSARSSSEKKV